MGLRSFVAENVSEQKKKELVFSGSHSWEWTPEEKMQSENWKSFSSITENYQFKFGWFELSLVIFFFSKLGAGITKAHLIVEILGSLEL